MRRAPKVLVGAVTYLDDAPRHHPKRSAKQRKGLLIQHAKYQWYQTYERELEKSNETLEHRLS